MTSDPSWYARLEQQGRLQPHLAPNVLTIDRALVDDDATWAVPGGARGERVDPRGREDPDRAVGQEVSGA
jgi:hypothetical protein